MIKLSDIKGYTPQMDLTPVQPEIMAPMQDNTLNNDGFEYSDETNELLRHHQQLLDEEQEYCHLCDLKAWVEKSRLKYYGPQYVFANVITLIEKGVLSSKEQIKQHFAENINKNYSEYMHFLK
jgi:hypothetical protein